MNTSTNEYLTCNEITKKLKITTLELMKHCSTGMPYLLLNNEIRFVFSDVHAWIIENCQGNIEYAKKEYERLLEKEKTKELIKNQAKSTCSHFL